MVERTTDLHVLKKPHMPWTQNTSRPWKEDVTRELQPVWWYRRAATSVHTHAHLNSIIYQPSGFHGYPQTCAHLHPKPIERKYKDKKIMKRTQVTSSEVNTDGFDGTEGKKRLTE